MSSPRHHLDVPGEPATRGDRRRERTRRKLINAARQLLQSPGYVERPISDITGIADIGLGSFYNHFASKEDLYAAAVNDVLDEHGALLDATAPTNADPAELVAMSIRSTGRLVITNPEIAHVLAIQGVAVLDCEGGLIPRARHVLTNGVEVGRFADVSPELLLSSIVGALLAGLHLWQRDPDLIDETWVDALAERLLVLCGIPGDEAHDIAHAPL